MHRSNCYFKHNWSTFRNEMKRSEHHNLHQYFECLYSKLRCTHRSVIKLTDYYDCWTCSKRFKSRCTRKSHSRRDNHFSEFSSRSFCNTFTCHFLAPWIPSWKQCAVKKSLNLNLRLKYSIRFHPDLLAPLTLYHFCWLQSSVLQMNSWIL